MLIGGLQKTSLIDYPNHLAAVIFTMGCNWRCPFCHNPELVNQSATTINEAEVLAFLKQRQGKLEGLTITGGEPTIQSDLIDFIKKVKELDYLVKLDTNGSYPEVLQKLINQKLIDYLAMDIKTRLDNQSYQKVTGTKQNWLVLIKQSIKLIKNSGIDYEFRITMVPGLISQQDLLELSRGLVGAKKLVIQQFVGQNKTLDKKYQDIKSYLPSELGQMKEMVREYFEEVEIRGV